MLAGITIGAIAIPGQIAVAKVAGMPPSTGLWAAVAAGLFAAFFVVNKVLWIGSDSTTAPMIFAGVSLAAIPGSAQYISLTVTLALMVGILLLMVAKFQAQWLADLLSRPVIVGFMTGVAVIIVVGQIPALVGIPDHGKTTLEKLWQLLTQLGEINWVTAAVGVGSLLLLAVVARVNARLPGALLVMVVATLATATLSLTRFNVAVLGPLETGPPTWVAPDLSLDAIRITLPTALAIALIAIAQTAATSRSSADAGKFSTDLRSDFAGLGVANVASAAVGAYPVNASPGATAVMASSGAKSQLGSVIGAGCVLVVVLFAGGLLADLPSATLAAVMILLSVKIINIKEMRRIRAYSMMAWLLMATTFVVVVVLGVELGVLTAVVLAVLNRAVRSSRPELDELGRRDDGHWLPISDSRALQADGGILVFRLNGPLWFANASWFHDEIEQRILGRPDTTGVIIDTTGIDDLDYTGSSTMKDLISALEQRGLKVAVTAIPGMTSQSFRQIHLNDVVPDACFFTSDEDAFQAMSSPEWAELSKPSTGEKSKQT